MANYPVSFPVHASSSQGIQTTWLAEAADITYQNAVPPEFGCPGGGRSPEDFYALALANCFVATFKVIAEYSKLSFENINVQGLLTVDKNEEGKPWMKHFKLKAKVTGCAEKEKCERVLQKASGNCLVLNSVRTEKEFEFEVVAA